MSVNLWKCMFVDLCVMCSRVCALYVCFFVCYVCMCVCVCVYFCLCVCVRARVQVNAAEGQAPGGSSVVRIYYSLNGRTFNFEIRVDRSRSAGDGLMSGLRGSSVGD